MMVMGVINDVEFRYISAPKEGLHSLYSKSSNKPQMGKSYALLGNVLLFCQMIMLSNCSYVSRLVMFSTLVIELFYAEIVNLESHNWSKL